MRTKAFAFFVCIGIVILIAGSASAQGRFAFIDSEKIQTNYKEWSKAQEQFNTELRAWEEEAAQMQQELTDMPILLLKVATLLLYPLNSHAIPGSSVRTTISRFL